MKAKKAEAFPMEEYDIGYDVYDRVNLDELSDDELSPEEAGFMLGYLAA